MWEKTGKTDVRLPRAVLPASSSQEHYHLKGNSLEMQFLRLHPRPTGRGTLGTGLSTLCFNKPPDDSEACLSLKVWSEPDKCLEEAELE